MRCDRCGVENIQGARFCTGCGHPLVEAVVAPAPAESHAGAGPEPKTSGLAIASLVLGIIGLCICGIGGIVGLILGCVALGQINNSGGQLTGRGLAIAGIVLGILSILWMIVSAILFFVCDTFQMEVHKCFVFVPQLIAQCLT